MLKFIKIENSAPDYYNYSDHQIQPFADEIIVLVFIYQIRIDLLIFI